MGIVLPTFEVVVIFLSITLKRIGTTWFYTAKTS